ncbi:MAG TPA: hypothetical protein VFH59_05140 [Frateuria sp.]|uniref:hypothetical protein n=1 Tax=Frateuria sp. TaxID=2211372 RepID=UPI002D7FCEB4|nr:hypothetical protein [Frateuria sp.]HET6804812.1 hypothetical protein [Frateuria sp.]
MHLERTPKLFVDADGYCCARVPLAKAGMYAVLFAGDLARLVANGIPLNWFFNLNGQRTFGHVKVAIPHDNVRAVARLITGAGKGRQVHYRDGNRLNLRRGHRVGVEGGRATVDAAELLEKQAGRAAGDSD